MTRRAFFRRIAPMEFTQENIDALQVNEVEIMKKIAEELNIRINQVSAVISLVDEGCTIPFIARYRKEKHGSLDEVQVRDTDHLFKTYKNLEERRLEIVRGVFAQGKLTESLYNAAMSAKTLAELEDLWAPFKKKKKTRGMVAIEKGLEPLADAMCEMSDAELEEKAAEFVKDNENPELSVSSKEDALQGAMDIIAERISQDTKNREAVHDEYMASGKIKTKGIVRDGEDAESAEKTSTYKMYWDFEEALNRVKPHHILAINRGEREGALDVEIDVDLDGAVSTVAKRNTAKNKYFSDALEDGVVRLLSPAVVREIKSDEADEADTHGIGIFSENLKNLLMTQPIKGSRVLGVDPGIRTGTKCAALDETGKYLGYFLIKQVSDPTGSYNAVKEAIKKYNIQVVAVGNGTGSQEVQQVVSKVISENYPDVRYTVVDESGASVYSASDIAREEFPELDLTIRGAISMGRRLQDPLAELVKIDPKAIGVGLYQHDVNQKRLSETLDEVVGSVVNQVGVNLNTASASLLKYVSGINSSLAKKIVAYRDTNGKIKSRAELKNVSGLGPKTFEQCAGFLKIPESEEILDNTWVHPENYAVAKEILPFVQRSEKLSADFKKQLVEKYQIGETTISDIAEELQKPNRDPRDEMPAPIMQKGVLVFEDLKVGMKVTGKIKNVVDFGAFVDIGLHETALIHVSELSDSFVSNPMDVIKVGDVKEFTIIDLDTDRKRISLSLKTGAKPKSDGTSSGKKKVVVVKKGAVTGKNDKGNRREFDKSARGSDDGTMYNPFAALLKR